MDKKYSWFITSFFVFSILMIGLLVYYNNRTQLKTSEAGQQGIDVQPVPTEDVQKILEGGTSVKTSAFPYVENGTETAVISPLVIESKELTPGGEINLRVLANKNGQYNHVLNFRVLPVKSVLRNGSIQSLFNSLETGEKARYTFVVTLPRSQDLANYIDDICSEQKCKDSVQFIANANQQDSILVSQAFEELVNGEVELSYRLFPVRMDRIN